MKLDVTYTTERYTAEVDAKAYIRDYRRADYFIEMCRKCKNYGSRYGCPPFDNDPLEDIKDYSKAKIIGVKILPADSYLPLSAANELMEPVTKELNEELLKMEKSLNGKAFGFVGSCPYCGGQPCARIKGEPCKHPDKVRPSLEAIGFDMSKTAKEILDVEIKWSRNEVIPEYLILICGLFYQASN